MSGAINEIQRLPSRMILKARTGIFKGLAKRSSGSLDDGLAERVAEAQICIDSNICGVKRFVNKERFGSEPKKKVRKKWRESSRRSVQGGGMV